MRPMILPTLYASSTHLTAEHRDIKLLTQIAEDVGIFAASGSDDAIHISILDRSTLPSEKSDIPLDLRRLIEFAHSHEVFELCLSPEEEEIPGLAVYEDDYVFTVTLHAKIQLITTDGWKKTHTCRLELEPNIFIDHRIFELFRDTCVKYAKAKLDADEVTVTFICKDEYDDINKSQDCCSNLVVSFDDDGFAVSEEG